MCDVKLGLKVGLIPKACAPPSASHLERKALAAREAAPWKPAWEPARKTWIMEPCLAGAELDVVAAVIGCTFL